MIWSRIFLVSRKWVPRLKLERAWSTTEEITAGAGER